MEKLERLEAEVVALRVLTVTLLRAQSEAMQRNVESNLVPLTERQHARMTYSSMTDAQLEYFLALMQTFQSQQDEQASDPPHGT